MATEERSVSLWKLMAIENISQHPKFPGRMDSLNTVAESGQRLQGKQSEMSEHEVSCKCEESHEC